MDPLLQRVFQVLLADGMRQCPESRLELDDGRRQVFEPAAQLHLILQNPDTFSWGEEDQGGVTGKLTQDPGGVSKSHPVGQPGNGGRKKSRVCPGAPSSGRECGTEGEGERRKKGLCHPCILKAVAKKIKNKSSC